MIDEQRSEFASPDGRLVVERLRYWDDRGGPYGQLCLMSLPDRRVLLRLHEREQREAPSFPAPGLVDLVLVDRRQQPWRVRIDAAAGSFITHPHDDARPLAELMPLLESPTAEEVAAVAARWSPPRGLRARLFDAFNLVGALVLAGGGLWMGLSARTARERWIGWIGLLFFGACAALPLWEAWRRRRRR